MVITEQTVRHIATLAQLALTDADCARLVTQMGRIVGFMEQLSQAPTPMQTSAKPAFTAEHACPLRDDTPAAGTTADGILGNAPAREGRFFIVPQVIG